jgi:hypothetical protein
MRSKRISPVNALKSGKLALRGRSSSRLAVFLLSSCLLLSVLAAALGQPSPYGQVSAIAPLDLFAARRIGVVVGTTREWWMPPAANVIAARSSSPEDPEMRPEFAFWVKFLLARQWLPSEVPEVAPYLKKGSARESRQLSCFYAAYAQEDAPFMVKGYLDQLQVTTKMPSTAQPPQSVAEALAEARALDDSLPMVDLGFPRAYASASKDLKDYLRGLAEKYVNSTALPPSQEAWEQVLGAVHTHNAGFTMSWPTTGYVALWPTDKPSASIGPVLCSLWTNGRAMRITLDHSSRYMNSFSAYFAGFPRPMASATPPLNPDAIELWDVGYWTDDEGLCVNDPTKARLAIVRTVMKAPYAPNPPREGTDGTMVASQPWWSSQVKAPLSPLQWHIVEMYSLSSATSAAVAPYTYQRAFATELGKAADRARSLEDARAKRDAYAAIADRYAELTLPEEAAGRRAEILAALQKEVLVWDKALAYWKPLVEAFPNGTESFFTLQAESLQKQLTALGWKEGGIAKALNCGDLLRSHGLE